MSDMVEVGEDLHGHGVSMQVLHLACGEKGFFIR